MFCMVILSISPEIWTLLLDMGTFDMSLLMRTYWFPVQAFKSHPPFTHFAHVQNTDSRFSKLTLNLGCSNRRHGIGCLY